jgi:hypothetical protein
MLAKKIVEHNGEALSEVTVPLKGILVGNGATATGDWYEGYLTGLRINHLYAHGLFAEPLHAKIHSTCKNFTKGVITAECEALVKFTTNETGVLNQYDVSAHSPHCIPPLSFPPNFRAFVTQVRETCLHGQAPNLNLDSQAPLMGAKALAGLSADDSATPSKKEDPCDLGSTKLVTYLNRKDVQEAIHVTEAVPTKGGNFTDCGGSFGRAVKYTRIPQDETVTVYPALVGKIRILIFNGDQVGAKRARCWGAQC